MIELSGKLVPFTVLFTDEMIAQMWKGANARQNHNDKTHAVPTPLGEGSMVERNYRGIQGEVALQMMCGVDVVIETEIRAPYDLIYHGVKCQIRTMGFPDWLKIPDWKKNLEGAWDAFFHAHQVSERQVDIIGWTTRENWNENFERRTFGHNPECSALNWKYFYPNRTFFHYVASREIKNA